MKFLNETGLAHLWANLKTLLQGKQDTLTAGTGIDITNNVISATGGGSGASYTAGAGIDIDSNNIISKISPSIPLIPLLMQFMTYNSGQYNQNATLQTMLNRSSITDAQKLSLFKNYHFMYSFDGIKTNSSLPADMLTAVGDSTSSTFYYVNVNTEMPSQYTMTSGMSSMATITTYMSRMSWQNKPILIIFNPEYEYGSYYRWIVILEPEKLFQNIYFKSQQGLTSHSMAAAIDEVASKIPALPNNPATDGAYTLTNTINSGNSSYSWEEAQSGGTTYTAGANISINNGEISATDTTYTAGTNISITNGVISATDTIYTAGTGININNGEISSTIQGIPTAPSTAGTYILKCDVSPVNGSVSYSWESITVGGSY